MRFSGWGPVFLTGFFVEDAEDGKKILIDTPPKFNIDPEKWWLEDYFPIGKVTFQGLC